MGEISIEGFQKIIPFLDLKLQKESPHIYDFALIIALNIEFEKGFRVIKINKANKNGTKITYSVIKSQEDLEQNSKKIKTLISEFEEKYLKKGN